MNTDTIDFAKLKLGEEIGKGTFGKVFKATWLNKTVAIKKINLNPQQKDIEREYKQLSRANHDNIIFLHGISINDDFIYLVMEYVDGGPLSDLLHNSNKEYKLSNVINWAQQIAKAIAYLHAKEPKTVIHRDLKPSNILLDNGHSSVKICDFGSVRFLATLMTKDCGTAEYMAPEVFNGKKYTEKCDVYSWAITVWEMLSRKKPYSQLSDQITICTEVDNGLRPDKTDKIIFDCPENIINLIKDCWAQDPEQRSTMNNILDVLNDELPLCSN